MSQDHSRSWVTGKTEKRKTSEMRGNAMQGSSSRRRGGGRQRRRRSCLNRLRRVHPDRFFGAKVMMREKKARGPEVRTDAPSSVVQSKASTKMNERIVYTFLRQEIQRRDT